MTPSKKQSIDFSSPAYYNNRELSWLSFNERVLQEAVDERTPLLERLKFLAIFSSNLDEFFSVRVAGLKDQVKAGYNRPENKAGMTPKQQLAAITDRTAALVQKQDIFFTETILPLLDTEGIQILTMQELNDRQQSYVETYFRSYVFPVLTPMAVDSSRPFPMLLNKSLHLAVRLQHKQDGDQAESFAIVQIPAVLSRFIELPAASGEKRFMLLEHLLMEYMPELFKGYDIISVSPFRITRNADLTIHEEGARDLLQEIEKELKKRRWGAVIRLEYQKGLMDEKTLRYLVQTLDVHEDDVYRTIGPLDLSFLFGLYSNLSEEREHLVDETLIPQTPEDLIDEPDIFEAIEKKDLFFHHPYESFQPIVDFITAAAHNPEVLAIKQTLYRVSGDSPIIKALLEAADNGKQVTVLVELKARFDEENNIIWAKKLEKAGAHVIFGVSGLKTHSKITLVVKEHKGKIKRYVHLGTGNYNDSTAKLYTDMGILTMNTSFGEDATNFFNHISGFTKKPKWNQISTAPTDLREDLLALIDREIAYQKKHGDGRIIAKMNSLTDKPLILKLYEASAAGVKIDLIIRGICCLKPGIKGVSENIHVISIIGRFLEHSRIFFFHSHKEEKMYLSSADWMTRNMDKRIEIMFPVFSNSIKKRLKKILETYLKDNVKARYQDNTGTYHYVSSDHKPVNSQLLFHDWAARFVDSDGE